jgi:flagellar hook-length control protein FliK
MIGLQLLAMMGLSAGAAGSTSGQGQNQPQGGQAAGVNFQTMLGQLAGGANAGGMVVSASGSAQAIEGAGLVTAAAASNGSGASGNALNLLSNAVSGTTGIGSDLSAMLKEAGVPDNMVQGIINIASANAAGAALENGAVFTNLGNQAGLIVENSIAPTSSSGTTGSDPRGAGINSQTLSGAGDQTGNLTIIPNSNASGLGETITNVIAAYKNQYGDTPVQANGKSTDPGQPLIIIGGKAEPQAEGNAQGELQDDPALGGGLLVTPQVDLSGIENQSGLLVNPKGGSVIISQQIAQGTQGAETATIAKAINGKSQAVQSGQVNTTSQNATANAKEGVEQIQSVIVPKKGSAQGKALESGLALPKEILLEEAELTALPIAGAKAKKLAKGAGIVKAQGKNGIASASSTNNNSGISGSSASTIVKAAQSANGGQFSEAIAGANTTDKQAKLFAAIAQTRMMDDQMDKFGLKGNSTTVQASNPVDPMVAQQGSSASQTTLGAVQALQGTTDASTHDMSVANNTAPGRHMPTMPAAQLGLKITKAVKEGANEFQIRLNPEELGRIDVKLKFSASGKATAHIMAESKETLSLLQRDAHVLERALQDAGVKTDQNSLSFSLKEQGRDHSRFSNHDDKNSQGTTDDDQEDLVPLSDEDITEAVIASMTMNQGLDIRI